MINTHRHARNALTHNSLSVSVCSGGGDTNFSIDDDDDDGICNGEVFLGSHLASSAAASLLHDQLKMSSHPNGGQTQLASTVSNILSCFFFLKKNIEYIVIRSMEFGQFCTKNKPIARNCMIVYTSDRSATGQRISHA